MEANCTSAGGKYFEPGLPSRTYRVYSVGYIKDMGTELLKQMKMRNFLLMYLELFILKRSLNVQIAIHIFPNLKSEMTL